MHLDTFPKLKRQFSAFVDDNTNGGGKKPETQNWQFHYEDGRGDLNEIENKTTHLTHLMPRGGYPFVELQIYKILPRQGLPNRIRVAT